MFVVIIFSVSATAFYKCQSVLEFLAEVLRMRPEQLSKPLQDAERCRFMREIKGMVSNILEIIY